MGNDILTKVKKRLPEFSKGQKAVANYILESYEKAGFQTARSLGRTVGVSESTVVRFATELGYDGYPSMQRELREMILQKLTAVQRIEVAETRMGDSDIVETVMESDMDKLRCTMETLDRRSFRQAVEDLANAKRIFVMGARSCGSMANFLAYYLRCMFAHVTTITATSSGEVCEQLVWAEPGDVVLALSFPRYSTSTVEGVRFAQERGARVVGLTDGYDSPVGKLADVVLTAKSDMVSLVDSLVAPLSVINALIVALGIRMSKTLTETCGELEEIWNRHHMYETLDEVNS